MTTHGQTLRAFDAWTEVVGLREGDRYLIVNPFFHTFGYKAGMAVVHHAGRDDRPARGVRRRRGAAHASREERITVLPGPPTLLPDASSTTPTRDKFDLSSLRLAVTGAAAVPVELIQRMRDELTFETIITGYGLTETRGIATMCRHDDDPETIANYVGPGHPRRRGAHRRRRRHRGAAAASRARSSSAATT